MLSSKFLKDIMAEAYPIIQRQLEDAKVIASFRELVTANGGDWSALKALMKAHVEDSLDDSGDGKRVKKILEKADSSNAYAEMLGLANMNEKNFIAGNDEAEQLDPLASLRSNPALSIVDAANLKKKSEPQGNEVAASPAQMPSAEGVAPAKSAATTSPDRVEGIVDGQPIQPETVNAGEAQVEERRSPKPEAAGSIPATHAKYAATGEVTWETHPPEGVERGAISMAFGWAGQDSAVIADDLEKGKAQPIVKKGNIILDGWARYMAARNMRNLDGSPVAYPVVQYDGSDLLVDIISLNVNGRILSEDDKRRIAANLARQEPNRKDDIYRAFELWMEPV